MAELRTLNRRTQGLPSAGVAAAKGFDVNTLAHVHRVVGPAVIYRATLTAPHEADGPLVLQRTATVAGGADADPNVTPPVTANTVIGGNGCDVVVFFSAHVAATCGLGIEVWARTDVHVDGTLGTNWVWVKLTSIADVQPYQEYSVQTGQRPVFLRVASIAGTTDAVIRATVA